MIKFITIAISPEDEALVLGEKPDGRNELDVLLWGLAAGIAVHSQSPASSALLLKGGAQKGGLRRSVTV